MPVKCRETDDLVESTEGFKISVNQEQEHLFEEIDLRSIPPILGYNQVEALPDSQVILSIGESGDPFLVTGNAGKGKTLAYMSDPAPHWGCNFVYWEHYSDFWLRCLDLVLG